MPEENMRPLMIIHPALMDAMVAAHDARVAEHVISAAQAKAAREIRRAIAVTSAVEGMAEQRIGQTRGPTLRFVGRLLAEYSTDRAGAERWQIGEVWETAGGAYIAVMAGCSSRDGERDLVEATVIEPSDDEQARRVAVMDALNWTIPAREMAKKQLKWELAIEVA